MMMIKMKMIGTGHSVRMAPIGLILLAWAANHNKALVWAFSASTARSWMVPAHQSIMTAVTAPTTTTRSPVRPAPVPYSLTMHRSVRNDEHDTVDDIDDEKSLNSRRRRRHFTVFGLNSRRRRVVSRLSSLSSHRRRSMTLTAAATNRNYKPSGDQDDNDHDKSKNDASSSSSSSPSTSLKLAAIMQEWKMKWESFLQERFPNPADALWQNVAETWNRFSLVLWGFVAGLILAATALLVPIHAQVQTLTKPVTLFETILTDLEQAYVDPVDTDQLFETGMAAMLRSLDPYTEFEGVDQAAQLQESIDGKYGGVGLVIAGTNLKQPFGNAANKLLPKAAQIDAIKLEDNSDVTSTNGGSNKAPASRSEFDDEDDEDAAEERRLFRKAQHDGIRVVSAFEGYAFDYGIRVGDRLLAIDETRITPTTSVEQVRNTLRGEPGTPVTIVFERDGVDGVQSITMPRAVVRIRDVKLATLLGNPRQGIGYIQLSGFSADAGREMRNAIRYLQHATEDATDGERSLQGLVLDLRGNPGGLLTSAVDVSSLLVPKGSDIVSAKGRGFPGILYRSRVDPILDPRTKLAVLVNGNTASAAEIVSGAVQDLDVGVIIGADRTFGKGLVQNVEELPFNTALKFTVAKYYTPSGRCIQGINYSQQTEGRASSPSSSYIANKVREEDRSVFYTRNGRIVRDGGGIEADLKVDAPKASALEVTLLRSGVFSEFAAQWSKNHELTNNFNVDDDTYRQFISFCQQKQKDGELKLESLYSKPLTDLKKALKQSGYQGSEKSVEQLQARIVRDVLNDFEKYRQDIKEDISQNILARYLPESMLIERGVQSDKQVQTAVQFLTSSPSNFDRLLARMSTSSSNAMGGDSSSGLEITASSVNVATVGNAGFNKNNNGPSDIGDGIKDSRVGVRGQFKW